MTGMGYAQIGSSVAGGTAKGFGKKAASQTRVRMLQYNEKALYDQGELVEKMGKYNIRRFESKMAKLQSTQRAMAGVSGLTSESFEPVLVDTAKQIAMDKGLMEWEGREERRRIRNQAKIAHWQAKRDERESKMSAWGTVFSMGSS